MTVLTLKELWELQDKLIRQVPPGTLIDEALDHYSICVGCKAVSSDGVPYCSCDDDR